MPTIVSMFRKAIFTIFLVFLLFFVSGCVNNSSTNPAFNSEPVLNNVVSLNIDKKIEICREIEIYENYCYNNGIFSSECAEQIVEKVKRLYWISDSQLNDVIFCCQNKDRGQNKEAYEIYSQKIGKNIDQFTAVERRQAILDFACG